MKTIMFTKVQLTNRLNCKVKVTMACLGLILMSTLFFGGCTTIKPETKAIPGQSTAEDTPEKIRKINNLSETVVRITDDGSEWPPYTYYKRVDGKPTTELAGYSVDVIKEILESNGIQYTIELLPWNRAQVEVETGSNYDLLLNASYSTERDTKYYMSEPYYSTGAFYFYSKSVHPEGFPIKSKSDLLNLKSLGILGHNYAVYGLNDQIYKGPTDYESAIKMLHSGRYDIMPESLEILTGYSLINTDILSDKNLGWKPVPDMKPVLFHMLFTRNERGLELKKLIDEGLAKMKASGRLDELLNLYMPK